MAKQKAVMEAAGKPAEESIAELAKHAERLAHYRKMIAMGVPVASVSFLACLVLWFKPVDLICSSL